jgi:hypothetical protein
MTAFTKTVNKIKVSHEYKEKNHFEAYKLTFEVERGLHSDDIIFKG